MSRLRALLPSPVAQPQDSVSSPVSTSPVKDQTCQAADTAGTCHGGIGWQPSDPHDSGSLRRAGCDGL